MSGQCIRNGRFPDAGCYHTSAAEGETAVLDTFPRSDRQPQTLPGAAGTVALAGGAVLTIDAGPLRELEIFFNRTGLGASHRS